MPDAASPFADAVTPIPALPGWITATPADAHDAAVFQAGAALAHLHGVATHPAVPHPLWRERLALDAAEACAALAGRREGAAALRDALHLTRAGDNPGPGGQILQGWLRAVGRPICVAHLARALPGMPADRIAICLDAVGETPVRRAAAVIEVVLSDTPRAGSEALMLADAVLSRALGRDHLLPLVSLGLRPRQMRLRGAELDLACHRAVVAGVVRAVPVAAGLARAAARLRQVTPRLRAKTAARALDLFLSHDALTPGALDFMSDRAARRLCDRLSGLGVIRELTGRETFRLYGL